MKVAYENDSGICEKLPFLRICVLKKFTEFGKLSVGFFLWNIEWQIKPLKNNVKKEKKAKINYWAKLSEIFTYSILILFYQGKKFKKQ